jgi:hypothetical protein
MKLVRLSNVNEIIVFRHGPESDSYKDLGYHCYWIIVLAAELI